MILSVDEAMQMAVDEALLGAPFVSPNPKVGCVILDREGRFLSKGYHTKYGNPHAEVEALKGLSEVQLKGAHVVVTLEPCAHKGKTPSCAKHLATLPISRVTYGLVDPNPLVAGQGAEILQASGIQTQEYQGPLKDRLEEVCEEFLWNFRNKQVFVALKVAQSLDGKIALSSGESQWITGAESREKVHELRAQYDAVLVGKGTVLHDNPSLNVRHPKVQKETKVIILDRTGETLKNADRLNVFKIHNPQNIYVCVDLQCHIETKRAQIIRTENLELALDKLYELGIRSLLIEGGAQVYSEFLTKKRVQRFHIFTAPILLGEGLSWTQKFLVSNMKEKVILRNLRRQTLGFDEYNTGRF